MSAALPPGSEESASMERRGLPHRIADELRQDIASGRLQVGQPLRQRELAQRFGVSPTPVREALRQLEAEGLVHHAPNQGWFV